MTDFTVRVEGADQAVRALRTMEPETAKQVGKEISNVGRDLAAYIRANAPTQPPMSGWRETGAARGRTRGGAGWPAWAPISASSKRRGVSVTVNMTGAVAAIYESAGKNGLGGISTHPDGGQFIRNLSRYGRLYTSGGRPRSGRLAGKAIVTQYPEAIKRIQAACDRAVDAVNRRLPSWQ
jgi:hypothetical protein